MVNWGFLEIRNILVIGAIVLLTRLAFYKAVNALDGKTSAQNS